MRFALFILLSLLAALPATTALAAETPMRSLASLTADGYQVKAMSTIGPVLLFLQKEQDPKAYFCAARTPLGLDPARYGQVLGNARCTEVKE